jgi:PAS domain S-box-containing protein
VTDSLAPTGAAYGAALLGERLRLHDRAVPANAAFTALIGAVLVLLLWARLSPVALLAWYGVLLGALGVRLGVRRSQRRSTQQPLGVQWLQRHRLAFLLHGAVWAGLWPLLAALPGHEGLDAAAFVVTAMIGGSLVTCAFDLWAARLFAAAAASGLVLRLIGVGGAAEIELLIVALVFIAAMALAGRRGEQMLQSQVRATVAERRRAAEAERHAEDADAAKRALAEQNELFRQLTRGTRNGYWHIGVDGRTLDVNQAMCAMLGRSPEEIVGHSVLEFFEGTERELLERQLERRRHGEATGYEVDVLRPDGSRLHAYNQATPILDAQGRHIGSIGLWTDLTAQKNLELELRTYERVANSITDPVAVIDAARHYVLVNDAWCGMYGLAREQALGQPTSAGLLGIPTQLARAQAITQCLGEGRISTVTLATQLRDGRERILQSRYFPYRDGGSEVSRVIIVTRDITEQEDDRRAVETGAEYLRRTLNATGDAIFATDASDPNLPVRFANAQMLRMWGLPPGSEATLTPAQILAAAAALFADPEAELARIRDIIAHNRRDESRVRLHDGRVLFRRCEPALADGSPLRVWSFRDITAEEQALAAMRSREAEQRALIDGFPGNIVGLDAHGVYTHVNRRVAAVLGREPEDIVGRRLDEILPPARAAFALDALRRQLAGEQVTYERTVPNASGGEFTEHVTGAVTTDPHTGRRLVFGFGLDITPLKQAEQRLRASERELRALLGAFPGFIASSDQDGVYTFVNDRLAALLGLEPQQIIGRHIRDVLGDARYQLNMEELARVRAGETVRAERRYHAPDAAPVDVEVMHVVGPRQPDGRQMSYSFGQDVSEKKRALEALTAARDEAERANKAKSQFLSQMSHELRTPMNAIMGFAHLLRRDQRAPLAEHQQTWVGHILQGAQHLLELINDVLDLGRIEAGRLVLEPQPVDLCELIPDCLIFVRTLAGDHGVRLLPPEGLLPGCGTKVLADQRRLRQVVLNLLSNAIKYNRAGGYVQLACRYDGGQVVIEVRDSGQGISPAQRERLFQPFERLGAERGAIEGTGIGLALCRRLVLAMAGQIGVDSEPGTGSTFWISLPSQRALAAPAASAMAPDPGTPTPELAAALTTVLYIDDNEVNLLLMEQLLASVSGWRLVTTANPVQALQLAEQEAPQLVLLDIHMPVMDGYAVLARLRSHPTTADLPVVAVSADSAPADLRTALAAGFTDYLTKPLDLERVLQTLGRLAGHEPAPSALAP